MTLAELANKDQEPRDQRIFENMMENFFRQWAPEDRREAGEFHAQLSTLIRRVYIDAQVPLAKHIEQIIRAMPIAPFFPVEQKGKRT